MAIKFKWRNQYDEDADAREGENAKTDFPDPSLTQQQFKDDADLNVIMDRFGITDGAIPPAAIRPDYYGDFSDVPDFRTAMDATRLAQERFNALPADLREKFQNDPVQLWTFVNDPQNADKAVELGLLHRDAPIVALKAAQDAVNQPPTPQNTETPPRV